MKPLAPIALALSLAVALPACSQDEPAEATPAIPENRGAAANVPDAAPSPPGQRPVPGLSSLLEAHAWRLDSATAADGGRIAPLFENPEAPLQLDFADDRVAISNACNRMGAEFNLDADTLTFAPMVSTEMACAEPLMAMEREAHTRLSGSHRITVESGEPPRLRLVNGMGDTLVFVAAGDTRPPL